MNISNRLPEPFYYSGGKTGILLVHGFTGTPSELRPLGKYLSDKGYTVYAPLLKGHGTTPEDMATTCWQDWWQSTLEGYEYLSTQDLDKLFVVGLSMGGCLSLYLSTEKKVDGVISLCAPVWVIDRRFPFVQLAKFVMPWLDRVPNACSEIESYIYPYNRTYASCINELRKFMKVVKRNLSKVEVPALVVQSGQDETVQPRSGQYIYDHISSDIKHLSWYEKSGHIIVLDKERRELFEEIGDFIERASELS